MKDGLSDAFMRLIISLYIVYRIVGIIELSDGVRRLRFALL